MSNNWIAVVQTGSAIRRNYLQRETLRGLGLFGIRHMRVMKDTPEVRGMIRKVRHLVHVFEGPLMGEPTPEKILAFETLRRFNRRVTRAEQSAFWHRFNATIPNVIMRMDRLQIEQTGPAQFALQGIVRSSLEDFDQNEIDAFVLAYRQFTQNNDPISISSLSKIYDEPWMHPGARKNFTRVRCRHNAYLDTDSKIIFGEHTVTIRQIVDTVIYGGLAHSNADKARTFEQWEKSGIMGFIWAEFFAAMRSLMMRLKLLRTLNEQVLALADEAPAKIRAK